MSVDFSDRLVGANLFLQPLAKCIGQGSQPLVERKFKRIFFGDTPFAFSCTAPEDLAQNQGAIALLQRVQLGERLSHRQSFWRPGIHAGDKWVDGVIQKLTPDASPDKLGQALFLVGGRAPNKRLGHQSRLGSEGEERGG